MEFTSPSENSLDGQSFSVGDMFDCSVYADVFCVVGLREGVWKLKMILSPAFASSGCLSVGHGSRF